jgi:hypothetical protein
LELPLPCHGAILPSPVHAVNRCEHPRKASYSIYGNLLLQVFPGWLLQESRLKTTLNRNTKVMEGFVRYTSSKSNILIGGVRGNTIS